MHGVSPALRNSFLKTVRTIIWWTTLVVLKDKSFLVDCIQKYIAYLSHHHPSMRHKWDRYWLLSYSPLPVISTMVTNLSLSHVFSEASFADGNH